MQAVDFLFFSRPGAIGAILPLLVLAAGSVYGQAASAPAGRVIARAGADLEARADGPACGPRVKIVITANDSKFFEGEIPSAAKFFSNARAGHSLSCPQMTRMVAQGRNNGRIMFTAMADQGNGWQALILGSSSGDTRSEDALLAGTGGPTPKSVFRSNPVFKPAEAVLADTKDKYLCLAGATLACELILRFSPQGGDKTVITTKQAISGGKASADVTSSAVLRDGFFCADPSTSKIVVDDASMTEDARRDYAEQLLDRVKSNGEICTGFGGKTDAMTAYGFDAGGKSVDKARPVKLSTSQPSFTGSK